MGITTLNYRKSPDLEYDTTIVAVHRRDIRLHGANAAILLQQFRYESENNTPDPDGWVKANAEDMANLTGLSAGKCRHALRTLIEAGALERRVQADGNPSSTGQYRPISVISLPSETPVNSGCRIQQPAAETPVNSGCRIQQPGVESRDPWGVESRDPSLVKEYEDVKHLSLTLSADQAPEILRPSGSADQVDVGDDDAYSESTPATDELFALHGVQSLEQKRPSTETQLAEASFERFWDRYWDGKPELKKRRGNRAKALAKWKLRRKTFSEPILFARLDNYLAGRRVAEAEWLGECPMMAASRFLNQDHENWDEPAEDHHDERVAIWQHACERSFEEQSLAQAEQYKTSQAERASHVDF